MPIGIGSAIVEIIAAGINLRGAYDPAVAYAAGDAVRAPNGQTYIATAATTAGTAPPNIPWAVYSGPAGAAGSGYQAIYQRTTSNAAPSLPVGDAPAGWTAAPQGVDGTNRWEWVSVRTGYTGNWSVWSAPALAYLESDGGGGGLADVATDSTLDGDGTAADPLSVANEFTDDDEAKLDAIPDQGAGNANRYLGFDGSGDYAALDAPSSSGGLSSVATDSTLDGDGTAGDPLSVANEFTDDDESKLDGIEAGATADQTGAEIVTLLEGLSGNDRLPLAAVLVPNGAVTRPMIADDAVNSDKLAAGAVDRPALADDSVSSDAIITTGPHRAGPGIRGALVDLTTTDRLPATAVRDLGSTPFLTAPAGTGNLAATVDTVQELLNAVDGLATGSGGLNQAAVDARIYTLVAAMLTGNTETGIRVTYESGDNTIDFVVTGGGSTPSSHTRYWGRSSDTDFIASEFTGASGLSGTTDTFTLPTWTGNDYMAFAVPDDTGDITGIQLDGQPQIGAFQRVPGTLTINGTAYKVWRSNREVNFSAATAILTQA